MNKTKPQRTDPKQIKQFFADAQKRAAAARKNLAIDPETAYQIAYEAMIKASLALMLSHGDRPRKQLGHPIALIEFRTAAFAWHLCWDFCTVRPHAKKTQRCFLRHGVVTDTEAEEAVSAADDFLLPVEGNIKKRTPCRLG